eukprot:PhM_4_TR5918/c0_g1_i2/m.61900/K18798/AFG1, LACE1; peroxisome-assembly ATPase
MSRLIPSAVYNSRVATGKIKPDTKQLTVLTSHLDRLHTDLETYGSVPRKNRNQLSTVRGVYVFGGVGCGKTYVMDMFYENLPRSVSSRRVHFHSFMIEAHKSIFDAKKSNRNSDGVEETTKRLIHDGEVLCFDEMMVTDIADAMVLKRLFDSFYRHGCVTVTTSNRPPDDLYKHGLNREIFVPFIEMLKVKCDVHNMDSDVDYRMLGTAGSVYFTPNDLSNQLKFNQEYERLCRGVPPVTEYLPVLGRLVDVPGAVGGVCKFTFFELCAMERSAVDYQEIARKYHTVFLEDLPCLSGNQTAEIRRFIVALDVFYQHHVKLIVLAEDVPEKLYQHSADGYVVDRIMSDALGVSDPNTASVFDNSEEKFMMDRAVSRLCEMRSLEYLRRGHKPNA